MSIRFFLDISPDYKGNNRIREHYEFKKYNQEKKAFETLAGMVDEGVRVQHAGQYLLFSEYYKEHEKELHDKLHAGEAPLFFDYQPKEDEAKKKENKEKPTKTKKDQVPKKPSTEEVK